MKKISQIETGGRFLYGGVGSSCTQATGPLRFPPNPSLNALSTKTTRTIGVFLPCAAN